MNETEIRELFTRNEVPLSRNDVWSVQQALVVKHSALERLAVKLGIVFDPPTTLYASPEGCAFIVSGRLGDKVEWSTGECRVTPMVDSGKKNKWGKPVYEPDDGAGPGNYAITPKQGAYPYAMAEKRGKDRVIIKLANLHGAYSEEEADDFKQRGRSDEEIEEGRQRVEAVGGKGIREYQNEDRRDAALAKVVTSGRLDPPVQRDAFNLPPVDDGTSDDSKPTAAEAAHADLEDIEARLRARIKGKWESELALRSWFDMGAVQSAFRKLTTTQKLHLSVDFESAKKALAKASAA